MTLKQAFTLWANEASNIALAAKSRSVVQKLLLKKYSDIDLEQITKTFAKRLFERSTEPQESKTQAASILVHILNYGYEHGHCNQPDFDYGIARPAKKDNEPGIMTKIVNEHPDKFQPLIQHDKEQVQQDMTEQPKKPRGKQPRSICKLHPETLQILETYPSIKDACAANDIKKLDKALKLHHKCHEFYWCYTEEASAFEPTKIDKKQSPKKHVKTSTMHVQNAVNLGKIPPVQEMLSHATDDEIIAEIKRRGWKGDIVMTRTVKL